MGKWFFIFLFQLIVLTDSYAQNSPCVDSSTLFLLQSGNSHITVRDNVILKDTSIVIIGSIRDNSQNDSSLFIARFDKNNNILFSKRINGLNLYPQKVIELNNGDILLAVGNNYYGTTRKSVLFRFNINGNILWQKIIDETSIHTTAGLYTGIGSIYENKNGEIYLGVADSWETDESTGMTSGYYYIYKLSSTGGIVWKTTLIQNDNTYNRITAFKEENGIVSLITQQYINKPFLCTSTNPKSIGFFQLNGTNGSYLTSKAICLNYFSDKCPGSMDGGKQSALFLSNGQILIAGNINLCNDQYPIYSILTDKNFNILQNYRIAYNTPFVINASASTLTDRFQQISLFTRGYSTNDLFYATLNSEGDVLRQRKLNLPSSTFNSTGSISAAFKKPDNFLVFTNLNYNGEDVTQVMEFKGNNNQSIDCTGQDTAFVTSQIHVSSPFPFIIDTVKTELPESINTNFSFSDFIFQRIEICSSYSICDSVKIKGNQTFCMAEAEQIFTLYKNPECNKKPLWQIDTSAISYMMELNDTTLKIKFKKPWSGYLYIKSNICGKLNDSLFISISNSATPVKIGNDTTYCNPLILDAGSNFKNYHWNDNSINRYFSVTAPGKYFVTAEDHCGNIYSDTIIFKNKVTSLSLGNDSCVSLFPIALNADNGFSNYLWQNGTTTSSINITQAGFYYVQSTNGCKENFSDSIYIYNAIKPFSLGNDTIICPGNIISLQSPDGYAAYNWQNGSTLKTINVLTAGKYYVTITDHCVKSHSDTIIIAEPSFTLYVGKDTTICRYETIQLKVNPDGLNYTWYPQYNISNTTGHTVSVNPEVSTYYIVSAEIYPGCLQSDTVNVSVNFCPENIFVPTAFTPNNDGKNDLFKPIVTGQYENYKFEIFNRWGQKVFESNHINEGWNGIYNGHLQDGSFIWFIHVKKYANPKTQLLKGSVLIIR